MIMAPQAKCHQERTPLSPMLRQGSAERHCRPSLISDNIHNDSDNFHHENHDQF